MLVSRVASSRLNYKLIIGFQNVFIYIIAKKPMCGI